ncbi:MAG TPA: acetate--CoA ligase family protein [Stellaceae bacterium]|nr:acetate--CoA ligase family protein [Stellaceae bacterium]
MDEGGTATTRWEVAAVESIVRPRSIAIIGVSSRAGSAGHMVLANLVQNEYRGDIHLVGRNLASLEGRPCLPSVDELPEGVDLAVLTVPAGAVAESVAGLVRRKTTSAITFASGFAEMGEDERARQQEIGAAARAGRLALVGPNCLGYTNYVDGLCIGFMGFPRVKRLEPAAGPGVAVVAQSGGMGGHVVGGLEARGVACSYLVTVGNEAGIGLAEFIEYLAHDPATGVILAYGEQIRQPANFLAAAAAARAAKKPLVLLHPGRSARAQAAARSHTGALTGDHAAMRTVVRRAGVVFVETLEEMIDVGHILLRYPAPPVKGTSVLTFSGALCAIAQDYCDTLGLDLPPMSAPQKDALRPQLETFNPPENPLDLGTIPAWKPDLVRLGAAALTSDPANGSLIVSIPGHSSAVGVQWVERLVEGVGGSPKPMVLVLQNETSPLSAEVARVVEKNRIVLLRSPERAFRAMARLTEYGRGLAASRPVPRAKPFAGLPSLAPGMAAEWRGKEILRAIGIPVPPGALARSPAEARAIASRVGYPVAAKAQAAALAHKTEAGGVILGIADAAALDAAWDRLHANVARAEPGLALDGALIEAMGAPGLELALGAHRDPAWGPIVMVGLGGVWIEALGDVRLLAPDTPEDAIVAELGRLKAAKLLGDFRGRGPVDVAAVARAAALVGRLMMTQPEITEIDINPLVAHRDGHGVTALDALIVCGARG